MLMALFARIRRTELISPFFEASKSSWLLIMLFNRKDKLKKKKKYWPLQKVKIQI